jgi:large subunit ribosomal protein L25
MEFIMKFVASERTLQGTGASRRLRNAGRVPGIVYGGEGQPELIEIDHNALWQAVHKEAFHSSILEMDLGGKSGQVLLRDLQMHPFRRQILHVDFQRVTATTKINMRVPIHYHGEENSNAIKVDLCLVDHIVSELEIRCLPADLPERIDVDLSKLEKGDNVTLAEIALPKGVEPVLRGRSAADMVLAAVVIPVEEAEEPVAAPAADAAAAAATGAAPAAGTAGAAPAAGAAAAPAAGAADKGKKADSDKKKK